MWFGDLVTMKWWNDLWLNESFAEWASTIATAEATEWTEAWTTFQAMEKSWAYRQDQLPSTHPIVATINDLEDVQVNFDGITYAKGGSVLKQLVAWVGIDAFFAGVGATSRSTHYGNTELSDLLAELEVTSGRDLTSWSQLVARDGGRQHAAPEIETDAAGIITSFRVRADRRRRLPDASARTASRSASTTSRRTRGLRRSCAPTASSSTSTASATDVAELVGLPKPGARAAQRRRPRLREDPPRRRDSCATAIDAPRRHREPARARAGLGFGLGCHPRRRDRRDATTSTWCSATSRTETESTTIRLTLTQLRAGRAQLRRPRARAPRRSREVGDAPVAARAGRRGRLRRAVPVREVLRERRRRPPSTATRCRACSTARSRSTGLEIDTDLALGAARGPRARRRRPASPRSPRRSPKDNTANGQQAAARARATIPTAEAQAGGARRGAHRRHASRT